MRPIRIRCALNSVKFASVKRPLGPYWARYAKVFRVLGLVSSARTRPFPSSVSTIRFSFLFLLFHTPLSADQLFTRSIGIFQKYVITYSNTCGRHFLGVQIYACTILDCTITTIMNTSLYFDGIPGAFPTKYTVYYCILAVRMAGYSLQIVWLDQHITTSQVYG